MNNPGATPSYSGAYEQIVQDVVGKTHSEIILFFVIVLVILVVVLLPLYYMILRDRKARLVHENIRQDKFIEREKQVIEVIKANTEAITGLKSMLEISRTSTSDSLTRIHERIDNQCRNCSEHGASLARIESVLGEIVRNQRDMTDANKK